VGGTPATFSASSDQFDIGLVRTTLRRLEEAQGQDFIFVIRGVLNFYNGVAGTIATSSLGLLTTNVVEGTNSILHAAKSKLTLSTLPAPFRKTYTANTFTNSNIFFRRVNI